MSEHYLALNKERSFEFEDSHKLYLIKSAFVTWVQKRYGKLHVANLVQGKEVLFYFVLVTSYLEYYIQFWVLYLKRHIFKSKAFKRVQMQWWEIWKLCHTVDKVKHFRFGALLQEITGFKTKLHHWPEQAL